MGSQYGLVLGLLAVGFAMGVVFDVYNTVAGSSRWLRWLRSTLDLCFWVISALVTYYVLFVTDNGVVRLFAFVLLFVGYTLYRFTIRRAVIASAFVIVRVVRAILGFVYRSVYAVTIRPIRLVLHLVWAVLRLVYRFLCVIEGWVFRIIGFWLNLLLIRWVVRRRWVLRSSSKISGKWEELWVQVSNWLKNKWIGA